MRRIRFKGKDYIADADVDGAGFIATEEAYRNGWVSFAHLYRDGTIKRFGIKVGNASEIEWGSHMEDPGPVPGVSFLDLLGGFRPAPRTPERDR